VPKRGERLLRRCRRKRRTLFQLACERDLDGIVAKRKGDPYLPEHATWFTIRNHKYSRWVGREELFERERASTPIGII
jgi:hypothetical protein